MSAGGGVGGVLKNTRGEILDDVGKPGGSGGSEGRSRGKRSTGEEKSTGASQENVLRSTVSGGRGGRGGRGGEGGGGGEKEGRRYCS